MRGSTTSARLLAPLVGAALLFAACGDSDGGSSAAASQDWCTFAEESDVVEAVFDTLGTDQTAVEAGMKQVKDISERLPRAAPDEIKDDAKVLSEGTLRLVAAIEAADYNIIDADLSFMAKDGLEDKIDAATDNIGDYTERKCGRGFGSSDDDDDDGDVTVEGNDPSDEADDDDAFDPGDGTIREQMVTQFESLGLTNGEATCIADNLDFSDPAVQSGDVAAMLGVFETCGIGIDRLANLGG